MVRKQQFTALIILILTVATAIEVAPAASPTAISSSTREVQLTIKVVFLGITSSQIDTSYLTSYVNTPRLKYQSVIAGPINTGVVFNFNYQTVFANSSQISPFLSFLNTTRIMENVNRSAGDKFNPFFKNQTSGIYSVSATYYDADKVEGYFQSAASTFGTTPIPGYTLYLLDLHNYLPSFNYTQYLQHTEGCSAQPCNPTGTAIARYYNRTLTDVDLGLVRSRHYMTGWGGNNRFSFIDVSAGPSYWTGDLPIQIAAARANVDLSSSYGRTWLTETVADYISGAVYNLFAADQLYPVGYSEQYSFHLFVIDNRTLPERALGPSLDRSLNATKIKVEIQKLVPFANVTVIPEYHTIDEYSELGRLIYNSTGGGLTDPFLRTHVVDARPVYQWLTVNGKGNINRFLTGQANTIKVDIPALIFAFKGDYNFGFTFKGDVFMPSTHNHASTDKSSIFGVALGDIALVSHGQADLTRGNDQGPSGEGTGLGFTATVMHELGHMMGLNHPFLYDAQEDFTDTVMGYYPGSTHFSRYDRDTILRGINDELLGYAQSQLSQSSTNFLNSAQVNRAKQAVAAATDKYNKMDYEGAVSDSLTAAQNAQAARGLAGSAISNSLAFALLGLIVGAALGLIFGYAFFRRRTTAGYASTTTTTGGGMVYGKCPTCGNTLRWDPVGMHWYCDRCQKPI